MNLRHCFILLVIVCGISPYFLRGEEQVYWESSPSDAQVGQPFQLRLIFEQCEPEGSPILPMVDGLSIGPPSISSEISIINLQATKRFSLIYPVEIGRTGRVEIASFEVNTSNGKKRVAGLSFDVSTATPQQGRSQLKDVVLSRLLPQKASVWAGEVFDLVYDILIAPNIGGQIISGVEWRPENVFFEDWSSPLNTSAVVGGQPRNGYQYRTRAVAIKSGTFSLSPATQRMNLEVSAQFLGFLKIPDIRQVTVTSEDAQLEVKPLPTPAPTNFLGAVGKFKLDSRVVPLEVNVNEPITWTLELSGTGNWPNGLALPEREVEQSLRVIQPQSKKISPDGKVFDATLSEDVILVPTEAGQYTFGPISYSFFDPESGNYQMLTTEPVTVTVHGVSNAVTLASEAAPGFSPPKKVEINPALRLPRDPLSGFSRAGMPLKKEIILLAVATPFSLLLAAWLFLARQRSFITDPLVPRRRAWKEARTAIEQLRNDPNSNSETFTSQLKKWRQQVAILFGIDSAVPIAQEIYERTKRDRGEEAAQQWYQLWQESDHCLFGPDDEISAEWFQKAEDELKQIHLPKNSFLKTFRRENWLPLFVISWFLSLVNLHGETGLESYRNGKFNQAEIFFTERLQQAPTDWIARNNLALSLAQQEQWAKAAAHWTAARILSPRDASIGWNFAIGLERAGFQQPALDRLKADWSLFRLLSPFEWQIVLIGAGVMAAIGFFILLLYRYEKTVYSIHSWAVTLELLALLSAVMAFYALSTYGNLADRQAGIVFQDTVLRSIPTDADTQQAHEIPAGTLLIGKKRFLGWIQVRLNENEIGWLRARDIIFFYQNSTGPEGTGIASR